MNSIMNDVINPRWGEITCHNLTDSKKELLETDLMYKIRNILRKKKLTLLAVLRSSDWETTQVFYHFYKDVNDIQSYTVENLVNIQDTVIYWRSLCRRHIQVLMYHLRDEPVYCLENPYGNTKDISRHLINKSYSFCGINHEEFVDYSSYINSFI